MDTMKNYLEEEGPCLASQVTKWLTSNKGLKPDAARKRLSRAKPPIRSFPVPLFPKKVRFMYLESQRQEERFWSSLQRDLRTTGSIYGMALDGVLARRGAVSLTGFSVISGATEKPVKGQVTVETALERLQIAGLLTQDDFGSQRLIRLTRHEIGYADIDGMKARDLAEGIVLDGLREWAKNLGAASYNTIRIRGEEELKPIGQFCFDLAGPSYLIPLRRGQSKQPGFLVADVFAEGVLDEHNIRYFLRKAQALHATMNGSSVLPILVAEGFTSNALTKGHAGGILMATPSALFGKRVGQALASLLATLKRAAAYASSENPNRIIELLNALSAIEGRANNLRGPLFELVCAYLARKGATSIDMGIRATDSSSGKTADIDIMKVMGNAECIAIECKGKEPGGVVTDKEVGEWLKKLPVIRKYLRTRNDLREANISFELWISGVFTPDALQILQNEQQARTTFSIRWRNGEEVYKLATSLKEKTMADSLRQHFLNHPFTQI